MTDSLIQRFLRLPADVRGRVASREALDALEAIEQRENVQLADLVMAVVAGDVAIDAIARQLETAQQVPRERATAIERELRSGLLKFLDKPTPAAPPRPAPPVRQAPPPVQHAPLPAVMPPHALAPVPMEADEHDEIRKHREQLARQGVPPARPADAFETVLSKSGVVLDASLLNRFRTAAQAFRRGIRPAEATKELFARPAVQGGLGIAQEKIPGLLAALTAMQAAPAPVPAPVVPPAPTAAKPLIAKEQTKAVQPPPAIERVMAPTPVAAPVRRPVVSETGKPRIADIQRPRPMNPVDELASVTPEDFRALAPTLQGAGAKVLAAVERLAQQAYSLRPKGIAAWRRSPLVQLYLAIGAESLQQQRSIEDVIQQRTASNLPVLSADEFYAVADINKRLTP